MDSVQRTRLTEVDWLANSPIGPYPAAFKRHLTKRRHAAHTIASYLTDITHFARWACTRRVPLARIDEVSVTIFFDDHLRSCACTGPVRHGRGDHSAALGHLLLMLRAQDAIVPPPVSTALASAATHHGQPLARRRIVIEGGRRRAASLIAEHGHDLRQAGQPQPFRGRTAVARERVMSGAGLPFKSRIERFLVERRGMTAG